MRMATANLKSNFSVVNKYSAFYTGGKVQVSADGEHVFCQCGPAVKVLHFATGIVVHTLQHEDDIDISCFVLSPDDQILVTSSSNLVLREWDWKHSVVTRSWKAVHVAPISSMAFDTTSTLLATGGADASIKVWDVIRQYCTNNLRQHRGVVSLVKFHPDSSRLLLFAADDDYDIRVWSLETSKCTAVLKGHYSAVTGLDFTSDGQALYSCSRDRSVLVWDLSSFTRKATIAINESMESLFLLPSDKDSSSLNVSSKDVHFVIAGENGKLKVWNASRPVFSSADVDSKEDTVIASEKDQTTPSPQPQPVVTSATYVKPLDAVCTTTHEHNIVFYHRDGFRLFKQFVGHNDEILDVKFWGADESHVVVATNSPLIKIFNVDTWVCRTLAGHADSVVSIDTYQKSGVSLLASGSKDNVVRVWSTDAKSSDTVRCIAAGYGHTHTVMAVALSRLLPSFLVSGGRDLMIKVWTLPRLDSAGGATGTSVLPLQARLTQKAHDKEIQSLAVSPNDKLIASGSRDKKAKLWNAADLTLVGVLTGHTGGIWCVQFSPVDQCLATASADSTIRMWALSNFTCVRTFQGHSDSVLKIRFVVRGMQLLSSDSGGLVKLWNVKNGECVKTLEAYDSDATVWALAINSREDRVITGASNSTLILWKDVTEEEVRAEYEKKADLILKEQELANLLLEKKYLKAIALAITLEQPFRVLSITKEILDSETGEGDLKSALDQLRDDQINSLLKFSVKWITNGRHSYAALFILQTIFQRYLPEQLDALPDFRKSLEGLLVYTDRHHERHRRMLERALFVDYTVQCMQHVEHRVDKS